MEAEYAVYDNDEFQFIGTKKEIAERLKIKESSVRWYLSRQARQGARKRIIIKIDDEV